uniref:hypothetical protein n=1 Tax=Microbulbifer agarilyticus TaxID=260552 RepID=UPI00111049E2|nr:hypothetical protein [Microbulbifer agarilyticus]
MKKTKRLIPLFFLPLISSASPPIQVVELTPKLAEQLGFQVKIEEEELSTLITFSGPESLSSGCVAARSGSFVLSEGDKTPYGHISELPKMSEPPQLLSFISNSSKNTLYVFIDYFCPKDRALDSRRYAVPSVRDWDS